MKIAIIKYAAGNTQSVLNALERLGASAIITDNAEEIKGADKVIFPGVGEASTAMESLRQANLDKLIPTLTQPVLGICVGMQLLCESSEEGETKCLGVVPLQVKKFTPKAGLKIPQMGWNKIYGFESSLFKGVEENSYVYNVHSFYVPSSSYSIASCNYGLEYASAVRSHNFYGLQFHAEKSAGTGDQIIKNFLEL